VGEKSVKKDKSGSPHAEAGPLGDDKQLMGSRWGWDTERRIMGGSWTDSGRQRWQDKEDVSGY